MTPRRVLIAVLAVVVAGALVATTVGPGLWSSEEPEAPYRLDPVALEPVAGLTTPPELAAFYDQEPAWEECGRHECATVEVPLDYAAPEGRRIEIALLRAPAREESLRIGSLVVNPGGPGASGIEFAQLSGAVFDREILRVYDVVGFDPRGVGESAPIDCVDDETLDEIVAADPLADEAERAELERLDEEFRQGCLAADAELLQHVSTEEAARDVDIIRAALGEEQLTWFGASYGTYLGAQYADLFPERVGRMVLDGAVDPTLTRTQQSLAQARGFETALRAYVANCVESEGCFLGDSVDDGVQTIVDLLEELDEQPLTVGDRELTRGVAFYGLIAPLYQRSAWSVLNLALRGLQSGDGLAMMTLSDLYTQRGAEGYTHNIMEAIVAINCLDDGSFVPAEEVEALVPRFERVSPTFGRIFAAGEAACEDWPVESRTPPRALTAEGAAPMLVTGTTRDPATPLEWAESLAAQLESAVLIRRDGDGHTAYNAGNACVDDAIERYLVEGIVPAGTLDC